MELLCGILFSTDWSVVWVKKKIHTSKKFHRSNSTTENLWKSKICQKKSMCGKYACNLANVWKIRTQFESGQEMHICGCASVESVFHIFFFFCGKAKSMFFNWLLIEAAGWESVRLFFFPLNIWFIVNYSWRCRRKFWLQGNFNDLLFWFHQWRFHPISTEILNRSSLMLVLPWS